MRSGTRAAVALAVGLAGCGNYSTEDLRFLAALPRHEDLRVEVPAQGGPNALVGPCTTRTAEVWLWAKPTSEGLDAGVDFVLGLVDVVRRYPPTWREKDVRGWGPFDDEKHPGREIRIVIVREFPPELGGEPRHAYALQSRVKGTDAFTSVISGRFDGASASRGRGDVVLDFETMWTLGINDPDTPHGTMQIAYDRTSDPVTIDLSLAQDGFGIVQFAYGFAGYRDGRGAFDYAFRNAAGDLLTVAASYDAAGAGRAATGLVLVAGGSGSFRECWDGAACLVYVDDPASYSCASPPCSFGDVASCPAVPAPPFWAPVARDPRGVSRPSAGGASATVRIAGASAGSGRAAEVRSRGSSTGGSSRSSPGAGPARIRSSSALAARCASASSRP
jgi:hypothetical protein